MIPAGAIAASRRRSAGGGAAAHRYWRIYCRVNSGNGTLTGLSQLELRETSGGSNVATGAMASASTPVQAGTVAQLFDGTPADSILQWSGTGAGQYVQIDFGAGNEKDINEVLVWPNKDAANRTIGEFDVKYSDDASAWTTAWSCTYNAWVVGTSVTFTKPSAAASRYWRLRPDALQNGADTMSCAEMEMRLTAGGADQTGSGTASARTTFSSTFSAAKAFDNNTSTLWSGNADVADSSWLAYDFGSGVTKAIAEVAFTARNDSSYTQSPTAGWIESSPDGRSWLSRKYFSGLSWSTGSTNTISIP